MQNKRINPEVEAKRIESFLKEVMQKNRKRKMLIAVSGGIDSAVSATLCAKSLGRDNVFLIRLPYASLNHEGLENAQILANFLNISEKNLYTKDISNAVNILCEELGVGDDRIRRGNIMARIRMIVVFDLAKKIDALVCGTENKSEHHLGYFTRFGDEASDIEPIVHLYKTEVYGLANFLGLPKKLISQSPTAGLWDGQEDESQLGFTYEEADKFLHSYFDEKISSDNASMYEAPNSSKIEKIIKENAFKKKVPYRLHD